MDAGTPTLPSWRPVASRQRWTAPEMRRCARTSATESQEELRDDGHEGGGGQAEQQQAPAMLPVNGAAPGGRSGPAGHRARGGSPASRDSPGTGPMSVRHVRRDGGEPRASRAEGQQRARPNGGVDRAGADPRGQHRQRCQGPSGQGLDRLRGVAGQGVQRRHKALPREVIGCTVEVTWITGGADEQRGRSAQGAHRGDRRLRHPACAGCAHPPPTPSTSGRPRRPADRRFRGRGRAQPACLRRLGTHRGHARRGPRRRRAAPGFSGHGLKGEAATCIRRPRHPA